MQYDQYTQTTQNPPVCLPFNCKKCGNSMGIIKTSGAGAKRPNAQYYACSRCPSSQAFVAYVDNNNGPNFNPSFNNPRNQSYSPQQNQNQPQQQQQNYAPPPVATHTPRPLAELASDTLFNELLSKIIGLEAKVDHIINLIGADIGGGNVQDDIFHFDNSDVKQQ